MKKLLLFIVIIIFVHSKLSAQSCLPEGITFSSQSKIDSFNSDYPGCTEIEGDLVIQGRYSIYNITGLSVLTSITGSLIIDGNEKLGNLSGLENLTFIGENLKINDNDLITSLSILNNVNSGSIHDLTITNNIALSDCEIQSVCDYLASPNGTVDIYCNAAGCNSVGEVANICGSDLSCLPHGNYYLINQAEIDSFPFDYPDCSVATGDVTIKGDFITDLLGLRNLKAIEGSLVIQCERLLTSLDGLDSLKSVGGDLVLDSNGYLSNLYALRNLTYIGNDLKIMHNFFSLTSLTGLENITSINGDLTISRNQELPNLIGLDNITSISGCLSLVGNNALTSLTGLNNLAYVKEIYTNGNHELENFTGLEKITSLEGSLSIINNHGIRNLSGLNNLTSIGKSLSFGSTTVENLLALHNLKTIGLHLSVSWSYRLVNLRGLENLTFIGGSLGIGHNTDLMNLAGLENTTFVGEHIIISYNDVLNSLTGMDNIDPDSIMGLSIYVNPNLTLCDIKSVCNYISADSAIVSIHDNADNCNSPEEVKDACQSHSVSEENPGSYFTIYPNPAVNALFISNDKGLDLNDVRIYSLIGQEILHQKGLSDKIDVSMLKQGLYILEIVSGNIKIRKKLIIKIKS